MKLISRYQEEYSILFYDYLDIPCLNDQAVEHMGYRIFSVIHKQA